MATIGEPRATGRVRLALLALWWERLWPPLAPLFGLAALFLVLALFDLPRRLPGWIHVALLALFALAAIASLLPLRGFRSPRMALARRRIERASGLDHRPLTAIDDRIASGGDDPDSVALWQEHRRRMAASVTRLRIGWPTGGWSGRDPMALRALLAIFLLLGMVDAGPDWLARIGRAFAPGFGPARIAPVASLDIWLNPPDYTGLAPQLLPATAPAAPLPVPTGSVLLAQVHGEGAVPRLLIDGKSTEFTRIDDANFKIQATLAAGAKLAVVQGSTTLGAWPIAIVPDLPPTIAFSGAPKRTERGALRLEYKANDDYGVESVKAIVLLTGNPNADPIPLALPLPGLHLKEAHAASFHDLTSNPWAGLPVTIRLEAKDALNQTGISDTVSFVLPERPFRHPVAKAIMEQRKELALHPERRDVIAETLSDLSLRPALYGDDKTVFLALRMAGARLVMNHDPETIPAVQQLLWDTALRIEEGRAPMTQQDLRQAMQALQDALARNAPDEEIERLIRQLRQAIDRMMQAMMENAKRQGLDSLPPVDPSQTMQGQDLRKMLDRARDLARAGARDAARDLLAQLQDMLENLQLGRMTQSPNGASRMMGAMQDMMRRQQNLLDRSFRDQRSGQTEEGANAESQEELRRTLGEMMRRLGEGGDIPQALGRAERAMRGAGDALRRGRPGDAIGPQTEALDQLQQGARGMAQRLSRNRGDGQDAFGEPDDNENLRQAERDPFGRKRTPEEENGWVEDGGPMRRGGPEVDTALRRARTILDELRRRAGEQSRPVIERDYIDRLLKEF